ncbi:MAG: hypothetical protein KC766_33030 [Myxococcales bacterium]|nr:hypothetical protein [Myxococcales bacterium]
MKACDPKTRRLATPSLLAGLLALLALTGSAGCAMDTLPEEDAQSQTGALIQEQNQPAEESEFEQAESAPDEDPLPMGTQSDDPTPVPWHEEDPARLGQAGDPTPLPWDNHVVDISQTTASQHAK